MTIEKNKTKLTQSQKNIIIYFKNDLKNTINTIKNCNNIKTSFYAEKFLTNKQYENMENMSDKQIKKILIEKYTKHNQKQLEKQLEKLELIYNTDELRHAKVGVDWMNYNPHGAYANCFYYIEKKVGGYGYDKLSTLTSIFFNQDLHLLKSFVTYIDKKRINNKNFESKFFYGVRLCDGLPYFVSGVGVNCHITTLKQLGFEVLQTGTNKSDVILIDKK